MIYEIWIGIGVLLLIFGLYTLLIRWMWRRDIEIEQTERIPEKETSEVGGEIGEKIEKINREFDEIGKEGTTEKDKQIDELRKEIEKLKGSEESFDCPYCPNSYKREPALKKHIGREHPEEIEI